MLLHQCDAHLGWTLLHLASDEAAEARRHLALAKAIVEKTGYHRRDAEVAFLEERLGDEVLKKGLRDVVPKVQMRRYDRDYGGVDSVPTGRPTAGPREEISKQFEGLIKMEVRDWLTSSLQAAISGALSIASPELWPAAATLTFLVNVLQARLTWKELASPEEVAEAVTAEVGALEAQLKEAADRAQVDAAHFAELRMSLITELTNIAISVEAWGGRVESLDQDVGLILDRLAVIEKSLQREDVPELSALRDRAYREIPLLGRDSLQDLLSREFDSSQLITIIRRVGLDLNNLRGETREEFAREIVDMCYGLGILGRFVQEVEELPSRMEKRLAPEVLPTEAGIRDHTHEQKLNEIRLRRLRKLEEQEAAMGLHCPPHILLEIEDLRGKIGIK